MTVLVAALEWMAWTSGTLVFVAGVFAFLGTIAVAAAVFPSVPRQGVLPMMTARGDRIYIGLLGICLVLVVYVAATNWPLPYGLLVAIAWFGSILRWG